MNLQSNHYIALLIYFEIKLLYFRVIQKEKREMEETTGQYIDREYEREYHNV